MVIQANGVQPVRAARLIHQPQHLVLEPLGSTTGVRGLGGNGECERQDERDRRHTHQPSKVGHAWKA
jgi:hypothetical protein